MRLADEELILLFAATAPVCFKRVMAAGQAPPGLEEVAAKRGLDVQSVPPGDILAYAKDLTGTGSFDALFLPNPDRLGDGLPPVFEAAKTILHRFGAVVLGGTCEDDFGSLLAGSGWRRYTWLAGERALMVIAVPEGYDAVEHATALREAGNLSEALAVLALVPDALQEDARTCAAVAVEKQQCYVDWDPAPGSEDASSRFFRAQREFYTAIDAAPRLHRAYHNQASFWLKLGNPAMAARLLRSIEHAAPHPETRRRLADIEVSTGAKPAEEPPPDWSGHYHPRILVITHCYSDYGMDTLYGALCGLLGGGHVTEFPWKPTLHGQDPGAAGAYPCVFNCAGEPKDTRTLVGELRRGAYDLVVYADMLAFNTRQDMVRLARAGADVPWVLLDTWDDCGDHRELAAQRLGGLEFAAHFKREMLAGQDYGPQSFPLPFAYPDERVPAEMPAERPRPFFWAGSRTFGLRRLYLEHLERRFGFDLGQRYEPDEYARALLEVQVGLNIFGFGFDTVRYWELPAHGCMVLSERGPHRIPHDFVDGESAVFFDDLADLEEKIAYYIAHPGEAAAIAARGRTHFLEYHTTSARARQFLGRLEQILGGSA